MLPNGFVTDVQQVALIVRDLDATIAEYADRFGIGPWRVINCAPPRLTDMRIRGEPVPYSMKLAVARTGNTMWEIIEPVDGPSIYQEFLDEHGEGLHHPDRRTRGTRLRRGAGAVHRARLPAGHGGVYRRDPLRLRRDRGTPQDHLRDRPPPDGS